MTLRHRRMSTLGFVVTLAALLIQHQTHADDVCEIRQTSPRKNAPPLRFCSWYHASSCCLPAHDADMHSKFLSLIEAGPTCEKYQNRAKLFLAMAFCYACDPQQPLTLSEPVNTAFFTASVKTAKICRTVADNLAPRLFSDCGLLLPDDRENACSPNSAIVPEVVWPDCASGEYVCQNQATQSWYCSATRCGASNTPRGFADAPCDVNDRTCDGALQFLNDNRGAKPPYLEDFTVEIVDEARCIIQFANASRCRCMRPPIQTSGYGKTRVVLLDRAVWLVAVLSLWLLA